MDATAEDLVVRQRSNKCLGVEKQFCLKVKQRIQRLQMVPDEDKQKQDQQWVCLGSPQGGDLVRIAVMGASKSSQFAGCSDLQESHTHDQADAEAVTLR